MTTDVSQRQTLTEHTADEILAWMGRRRYSRRELARRLGVSTPWVSERLNGNTAITLEDLARIAGVLDVPPAVLLPKPDGFISSSSRDMNEITSAASRPIDNRPKGRAQGHPTGPGRRGPALSGNHRLSRIARP